MFCLEARKHGYLMMAGGHRLQVDHLIHSMAHGGSTAELTLAMMMTTIVTVIAMVVVAEAVAAVEDTVVAELVGGDQVLSTLATATMGADTAIDASPYLRVIPMQHRPDRQARNYPRARMHHIPNWRFLLLQLQ